MDATIKKCQDIIAAATGAYTYDGKNMVRILADAGMLVTPEVQACVDACKAHNARYYKNVTVAELQRDPDGFGSCRSVALAGREATTSKWTVKEHGVFFEGKARAYFYTQQGDADPAAAAEHLRKMRAVETTTP